MVSFSALSQIHFMFPLLPTQDCYNSFWLLLLLFPIHILLSCQSDLLKCLRSYHSHLKTLTNILPGWQGPLWSSHSLPHLLLASPIPLVFQTYWPPFGFQSTPVPFPLWVVYLCVLSLSRMLGLWLVSASVQQHPRMGLPWWPNPSVFPSTHHQALSECRRGKTLPLSS